MYKVCIFDLDGTLTDTLESLTYSVNETLKEMGFSEITSKQCEAFLGNGARRLMEQALQAVGDEKASRIEEAMEIYDRILKENCTYHVAPYEGIVPMLQSLKRDGIRLAVLSNKPHLRTLDVISACFEKDTFAYVQGQKEGIPRKPDPAAVFKIMEELQVSKDECLYVGDSDVDMETGHAAGVDTVGVPWGFRSREILEEHGATYIVDKPEEIISIAKK